MRLPTTSTFSLSFDGGGECAPVGYDGDFDSLAELGSALRQKPGLGRMIEQMTGKPPVPMSPDVSGLLKRQRARLQLRR